MRRLTLVLPLAFSQLASCLNFSTETVRMRTTYLSDAEYKQEVAKEEALKVQSRIWAGSSQSPGWNVAGGYQPPPWPGNPNGPGGGGPNGQPWDDGQHWNGPPQNFMPQAPGPPPQAPQNFVPQIPQSGIPRPGPPGPPPPPPPPGGNFRPGPGGTWIDTSGNSGNRRPGPKGSPFINVAPPPKPEGPKIEKFQFSGKACPPGSVSHFLSEDRSTFTMIFDKFTVTAEPGPLKKDFIKHCIIRMDLRSPNGQQWAIWEQTYRGRVELDPGVRAARKSVYAFSGASNTMSGVADFMGPEKRDFIVKENLPMNRLVWAPCQQDQTMTLDIFTMVDNSRNPKGKGLLTVDSTDGKVTYKLGLKWQSCRHW